MVKIPDNSNESRKNIKKILIGSIISIIITLIGLILFSSLICYTSISESSIPTVTIIITLISILIGTSLSMSSMKKNGIINGGTIGLIYIVILYLVSSLIEKDFSLNTYSIVMVCGSILAGALGGIVGVNKK